MIGIDLLSNKGIQYIGNKDSLYMPQKTLIIVGVARGGTSLVAGTLHHLGVFTGDRSELPVFEDVKLASAFEQNNLAIAKDTIESYNQRHDIWAFKRPGSIHYNDKIHSMCRNPVYLFIFKDIFSVSNRNSISMKSDVLDGLRNAHNDYSKIIEFILDNSVNGFLFSYEKIMKDKESFVDLLIDVISNNTVSEEQKKSALAFIEPNPKTYLNASRITRSIGQIGLVEKNRVIGWGKYEGSDRIAKVELYINDKLEDTLDAIDYRQHAVDNNICSNGLCGYVFNLKKPLSEGDKVAVKLSDDIHFLRNSNQLYKEKV